MAKSNRNSNEGERQKGKGTKVENSKWLAGTRKTPLSKRIYTSLYGIMYLVTKRQGLGRGKQKDEQERLNAGRPQNRRIG